MQKIKILYNDDERYLKTKLDNHLEHIKEIERKLNEGIGVASYEFNFLIADVEEVMKRLEL